MSSSEYVMFAKIVEMGSLSGAARALVTSPSMISKRLGALEARFGVQLFYRTTRSLTLTPHGQAFHEDVIRVLDAMDVAENRLAGIRGAPSGPLRVSAPTSFGRLHIAPHLHQFLERNPKVKLEFDLSDESVDLYAGRIDLAVRITADPPANLDAHLLAPNVRVLCASPDYIARNGQPQTVEALRHHKLIAAEGQLPWQLWRGERCKIVDRESHVRTNSSEIVRELALCGTGIALRSLWDIDLALRSGALVAVLPDWGASAKLGIFALHPRTGQKMATTSAFVAFLKEILTPLPWSAKMV